MSVQLTGEPAEYRYFLTDLLSNALLAEIPFQGVSFTRAIKGAGSFSGNIPVIENTDSMSLYDNTMPGRTGLYVTRNGICVWGGIIWGRTYNLVSQQLSVDASEFTSYLYHRNVWKTWSHQYGATVTVAAGVAQVDLDTGFRYQFDANASVQLIFREVSNFRYNGFYTILSSPAPTTSRFYLDAGTLPNGVYPLTTVSVRTDTYEYIRSLIDAVSLDFTGLEFPNDEIEPGIGLEFTVSNKQAGGGTATLTTSEPHDISPGQVVIVRNVDATFNGQYIVTETPNATEFQYALGASVGSSAVSVLDRSVLFKSLTNYLATVTTNTVHGFSVGQQVDIFGVDDPTAVSNIFDGRFIVLATPTANTFSYLTSGISNVANTPVSGGNAVMTPKVISGTYGPYSANSNLQFEFSTLEYSGVSVPPVLYRGYELLNVGEELDKYSDTIEGFEYRVDCDYNPATASFSRTFVLIPIDFPDPPAEGEVSPISRFGAEQLVFEYPGNIIDIQIDEKSDDAATRFWVVGDIGDLGDEASQPYAAAASRELLLDGWPIIDQTESVSDVADEEILYDYARRYLSELRPPIGDIKVSVNGSLAPEVGDYSPGDWCSIIADDPFVLMRLASDLEPRNTVIVRKIDSITVNVPDSPAFPEKVDLGLIAEWEVDKRG
jgi:hypothetical protein